MRSLLLTFSATALFASAAVAQGADSIADSFGVTTLNGTLHGVGPTYAARFDAAGFEFAPVLGPTAPGDAKVQFALDGVRRGDVRTFARSEHATAPTADGNVVRYAHRRDLIEVYDVRRDGIEQRFVFAQRPAGVGDLVVSGRIATGLRLATSDAQAGLRYEIADLGGVAVGAVTGIDALGNQVAGAIRTVGERVEYTLPAWFVDRAAYPLTLDPLFGAVLPVSSSSALGAPDVAFDASNQRYCVVWNVAVSGVQTDVRGAMVSATGALVGGPLLFSNIGDASLRPRVANVNATNHFVIGWVRARSVLTTPVSYVHELMARTLDAGTGLLTNEVLIHGQTGPTVAVHVRTFDIGGESRTVPGANEALFVFRVTKTLLTIDYEYLYSGLVNVPASGDASLVGGSSGLQDLLTSAAGLTHQVTVSNHGGSAGRWFVAWTSDPGGAAPWSLIGRIVDSANTPCGSNFLIAVGTSVFGTLDSPTTATADGTRFAVAWNDYGQIRIKPGTWLGTCGSGLGMALGVQVDPMATTWSYDQPSLDFAQDKFVLAYRQRMGFAVGQVGVKTLDPATCATCGTEWSVETSAVEQQAPAIAATWSGSASQQDGAFVVWQTASNVRGIRYDATGTGFVATLGGSCGATGIVGYDGAPVLGSPHFALRLDAPTAPALALVIGLSNLSIPCGPCTLVPNADILMSGPGPHPLPLPCDLSYLGVQFWTQWLLFAPGGCSILPDFALSNAQRFTIGE
jgi:hypothetical protein